jgi:hypothetical protein
MNAPAGEENPNENCDEEIKKRVEGLLEPTREKHQRETTKKNLTGQNNEDKNETEEDVEEVVLFSRDVCFYGQQPSPWDRFSQWF